MPKAYVDIRVGFYFLLNGRLYKDSYGGGLLNKKWNNYKVHIVKILDEDRACPILLGDDYSDQLGWVSADELTGVGYGSCQAFYIS